MYNVVLSFFSSIYLSPILTEVAHLPLPSSIITLTEIALYSTTSLTLSSLLSPLLLGGDYCSSYGQSSTSGNCTAGYYCTNASVVAAPSALAVYGGHCLPGYYHFYNFFHIHYDITYDVHMFNIITFKVIILILIIIIKTINFN